MVNLPPCPTHRFGCIGQKSVGAFETQSAPNYSDSSLNPYRRMRARTAIDKSLRLTAVTVCAISNLSVDGRAVDSPLAKPARALIAIAARVGCLACRAGGPCDGTAHQRDGRTLGCDSDVAVVLNDAAMSPSSGLAIRTAFTEKPCCGQQRRCQWAGAPDRRPLIIIDNGCRESQRFVTGSRRPTRRCGNDAETRQLARQPSFASVRHASVRTETSRSHCLVFAAAMNATAFAALTTPLSSVRPAL